MKGSNKGIACKPEHFEEFVVRKLIKRFIVGVSSRDYINNILLFTTLVPVSFKFAEFGSGCEVVNDPIVYKSRNKGVAGKGEELVSKSRTVLLNVRGERRYSVLDVVLQTLTGHLSLKGLCPVKVVPRTIFGGNY